MKPSINLEGRKQRLFYFVVILLAILAGIWGVLHFLHQGPQAQAKPKANAQFVSLKDSQFSAQDSVAAGEAQQTEIDTLTQKVASLEAAQNQNNNPTQAQMTALQNQLQALAAQKEATPVVNTSPAVTAISSFTLNYLAPPVNNSIAAQNYVPSNTWAKAILIQGVDANAAVTGQGNTTPVIFQIIDDATGPNHTTYPLKGCRVSGEAYGDISSERAEIRLVSLSCVRKDGSILDIPVKGDVADIGGKEGIRGTPVMRNGPILFNAGLSGFMSGVGESLQQGMTTQSTSPLGSTSTVNTNQALQYGMLGGGSTALNQLAGYYIQRAEQYHPIIEVNSGAQVDIVFLSGFSLTPKVQNTPTINAQVSQSSNTVQNNPPSSIQSAESIMSQVNQAGFGQTIGVQGGANAT